MPGIIISFLLGFVMGVFTIVIMACNYAGKKTEEAADIDKLAKELIVEAEANVGQEEVNHGIREN